MKKIGILLEHIGQATLLRKGIESLNSLKVEWATAFSEHAEKLASKSAVDIILVDAAITTHEGVDIISTLKTKTNTSIVVFTDNIEENQTLIYECFAHGAIDVAEVDSNNNFDRLKAVLKNVLLLTGRLPSKKIKVSKTSEVGRHSKVLLIGASTGGPLAIASILAGLSRDFPCPIVIAQHLDIKFSSGLAEWLQKRCALNVETALGNHYLKPGTVYLGKADRHLILDETGKVQYRMHIDEESPYMPSINAFFKSFAKYGERKGIALLLTGMGSDGAEGLNALRKKGWHTIAEDEGSCTVYGMPKAAVMLGAAKEVLTLDMIPHSVLSYLSKNLEIR